MQRCVENVPLIQSKKGSSGNGGELGASRQKLRLQCESQRPYSEPKNSSAKLRGTAAKPTCFTSRKTGKPLFTPGDRRLVAIISMGLLRGQWTDSPSCIARIKTFQ
jgi:hypothetical protein